MSNFEQNTLSLNDFYYIKYKNLLLDNKHLSEELFKFKKHNEDLLEFSKANNSTIEELKIINESFCENIESIKFPATFLFCQHKLWKDRKINEITYNNITYKNINKVTLRPLRSNREPLFIINYWDNDESENQKEFYIKNDLSLVTFVFNNY